MLLEGGELRQTLPKSQPGWLNAAVKDLQVRSLPSFPKGMGSAHATSTSRAETHPDLQKPSEPSNPPLICTQNLTIHYTVQQNSPSFVCHLFCPSLSINTPHLAPWWKNRVATAEGERKATCNQIFWRLSVSGSEAVCYTALQQHSSVAMARVLHAFTAVNSKPLLEEDALQQRDCM